MTATARTLPARPYGARAFARQRRPGFADCSPSRRLRLDALAGWLQDLAWDDIDDAGLADVAVWVVRRTRIHVERFPRFGEHYTLTTFCSGLGRMWAERGTDLVREGETVPDVECSSIWVHLDVERHMPSPVSEIEILTYFGRYPAPRVSARLRHPPPDATARVRPWTFRAAESDVADHINNAAYWTPLEEELLGGADPERLDLELEYRTPAQPGDMRILSGGDRRWIVDPADEINASFLLGADFAER
ncbi:MAG: hypothetical protein JOZ07_02095 [Solirubrobacterales bacterium]|nr:hypothetical protein [Solirubrobacterales bacterium]